VSGGEGREVEAGGGEEAEIEWRCNSWWKNHTVIEYSITVGRVLEA